MIKSSFLKGLLNNDEKNIAEYLATWDDLNVFFKTISKSWDFISQLWKSDREINHENKKEFKRNVNIYLGYRQDQLCANLYNKFCEIFEVGDEDEKISSQKELDDYCIELENEAVLFQKEFSKDEDEIQTFRGNNFVDLRKYYLEMMVDQFKKMDKNKQGKILEEMVQKLN